LAPVPAVWAHVTVEHFAAVDAVSGREIAKVAELVRDNCAGLAPIELTVRRAEIWRNGVVCPVAPGLPLRDLWEITTEAGRDVTGARLGIQPDVYHPHLALAYAVNDVDDAPLRAWLPDHEVPEASLSVSALSLAAQQHDGRLITWRPIQDIPLGGTSRERA
jgi:2'-5' RNA ligase